MLWTTSTAAGGFPRDLGRGAKICACTPNGSSRLQDIHRLGITTLTLHACVRGFVKALGRKLLDEGWGPEWQSPTHCRSAFPAGPGCGTNAVSVEVKSEISFQGEFGGVEIKEHVAQCGICFR